MRDRKHHFNENMQANIGLNEEITWVKQLTLDVVVKFYSEEGWAQWINIR